MLVLEEVKKIKEVGDENEKQKMSPLALKSLYTTKWRCDHIDILYEPFPRNNMKNVW